MILIFVNTTIIRKTFYILRMVLWIGATTRLNAKANQRDVPFFKPHGVAPLRLLWIDREQVEFFWLKQHCCIPTMVYIEANKKNSTIVALWRAKEDDLSISVHSWFSYPLVNVFCSFTKKDVRANEWSYSSASASSSCKEVFLLLKVSAIKWKRLFLGVKRREGCSRNLWIAEHLLALSVVLV